MADTEAPRPPGPSPEAVVERVLDVVRALARETGGPRAERAVSPDASLEREVGLGSLERVELLARLERAFSRALDDRCLSARHAGRARARPPGGRSRRGPAPPRPRGGDRCRDRHRRRGANAARVAVAARVPRPGAGPRLPARRGLGGGGARQLRPPPRRGGRRRGRPARARHLTRGHRRPHAADRARLPALVPRHPPGARRPGAHLPARPPRPPRGVRRPPVRDPEGRRRAAPRHDPARPARGEPAEAGACRPSPPS